MAKLPNHLSVIVDKFEELKSVQISRNFKTAVIIALVHCSMNVQASENDIDGDGLTDAYETKIGSEPYLPDTDADSIKDSLEIGDNKDKPIDSDNDGIIDVLDYDDDNDGLPTYLESKKDTDNDGLLDYLDTDSDNDGIADGVEAGFWNKDENLDGIDDAFDAKRDGAVDKNSDGIDDNILLPDYNSDGMPDYLDANYPHKNPTKKIAKKVEPKKSKTTKTENNKDSDSELVEKSEKDSSSKPVSKKNKNEIAKSTKATTKSKLVKNIKTPKPKDLIVNRNNDSDNDGLSNALEKILGTNHLSRDSDNDNVSDAIEIGLDINAPQDSDQDGVIDALDNDDDDDGILTNLEDINRDSTAINDDTDSDGVPNYLDANDDGDDLLTKVEGVVADTDGDGILDYLDKNNYLKDNSNSSKVTKTTNDGETTSEAEVVVLFDGNAVFVEEETLQDEILNSVEDMLKNAQLNDTANHDVAAENTKQVDARVSNSSNKSSSHWNLF